MTRALAFFSIVILAAALAAAQDTSTSATSSTSSQTTTSSSQESSAKAQNTTVQGCLSSSSMGDNAYTLTQDQTGTVYTLTGNTDSLKSHVGHEVAITGQVVSSSSSATASGASSSDTGAGNQPGASATTNTGSRSLLVNSVLMISDHCASNGTPGPTGGANSGTADRLPQPSTILPLLGIIGLGSLIAGLFVRR
jgi:hypothetical protein